MTKFIAHGAAGATWTYLITSCPAVPEPPNPLPALPPAPVNWIFTHVTVVGNVPLLSACVPVITSLLVNIRVASHGLVAEPLEPDDDAVDIVAGGKYIYAALLPGVTTTGLATDSILEPMDIASIAAYLNFVVIFMLSIVPMAFLVMNHAYAKERYGLPAEFFSESVVCA